MGLIFDKREAAVSYTPSAGDTLETIVADEASALAPGITWQELAIFNWGTSIDAEVNRALVEQLGCSAVDAEDPSRSVLDPDMGGSGAKTMLLPKVWKAEGLALERTHTVTLDKPQPAPAIAITTLSKWFIPEDETCDIEYRLEGVAERADKVDLLVHASHYCKATSTADGELLVYEFEDEDEPIQQRLASLAADPRATHSVDDWKGESTATKGVLAPRPSETRHINVACSPYTVTLRYYKDAADRAATLSLEPFWPRFEASGDVIEDSLVIRWSLEGGGKLVFGQLLVWDKDDRPVYRRGLSAADLAGGEHDWVEGRASAEADRMPYRVQIQAHSSTAEANGLALAVMHTEVRLCAHPSLAADPDPLTDPQTLELSLAPFERKKAAAAKGTTRWYKHKLAAAGFHPGPINDDGTDPDYVKALAEVQRTYPKETVAPFTRLEAKGAENPDTEAVVDRLVADACPFFGNPVDRSDHTHAGAEALLADKDEALIVWVDDRHGFTDEDPLVVGWLGGSTIPAGQDAMSMESYRGGMDAADQKVVKDASSICRPWIPLRVTMPLLSKADELGSTAVPTVTDAMRAAMGPLRIDWTFDEIGEDLGVIDTGAYTAERARPSAHVHHCVDGNKDTHRGKDLTNCPADLGGIRPSTAADYFKAPFGLETRSLLPWHAVADATTEAVCTFVHDDLGQSDDQLIPSALGHAGVYFTPSTIAGDGYRVRARLGFAAHPDGKDHPNRAVLEARYPRRPQTHTATMRIWRKTSFRGYVRWGPAGSEHWGANGSWEQGVADLYRAAHVHFVHETGAPTTFDLATLIDQAELEGVIREFCDGPIYSDEARVQLDLENVWPWSHLDHFGIDEYPAPGVDFERTFMPAVFMKTWKRYRIPLIHLLLHKVERLHGLFRGHLVVEMQASPPAWKQTYLCDDPGCNIEQILLEKTDAGGSAVGNPCHVGGCTGQLQTTFTQLYGCFTCGNARCVPVERAGNPHVGDPCPQPCSGHLEESTGSAIGSLFTSIIGSGTHNVTYECNTCGHTTSNTEPKGPRLLTGNACGQPCSGTLAQAPVPDKRESIEQILFGSRTLGCPAVGTSLSATWVFCVGANAETWAHEIGHHRQFEHAASGPGFQVTHHDSEANPLAAIAAEAAEDRRWDRCCIMSYTKSVGDDTLYFCGKCILKNRGWKVEGLVDPGSGVGGP